MTKQSIAIDMDDVMTDAVGRFIELYRKEFNEDLPDLRLPCRNLDNTVPPERLALVKQFPHRPDFFKDMDLQENCQDVVRQLQEKYEVYIATAAMEFEHCLTHKYNWLKQHFPFISWTHIIFCGHKNILGTDYLLDDAERNLKTFKGTPLVYTAPHNAHLTGYTRLNNWQEVADYFLK
ncbi:MAG: 5' nucleotidase, NT5C type [Adhaeribacter sp.]